MNYNRFVLTTDNRLYDYFHDADSIKMTLKFLKKNLCGARHLYQRRNVLFYFRPFVYLPYAVHHGVCVRKPWR